MKYEARIHSKQARAVARALADPQGPVEFVLHVKSASMLLALAQKLELILSTGEDATAANLVARFVPFMREKILLLSAKENASNAFAEFCIPASSIRPSTWCRVIYMRPFYIVHTPGLFEEIAQQKEAAAEPRLTPALPRPMRFKM